MVKLQSQAALVTGCKNNIIPVGKDLKKQKQQNFAKRNGIKKKKIKQRIVNYQVSINLRKLKIGLFDCYFRLSFF